MTPYEWKQYIFKPEDFEGAGQYIVREGVNKTFREHVQDSGHLSTLMFKIGWCLGSGRNMRGQSNIYSLIAMSDGMISEGYFTNTGKLVNGRYEIPSERWVWVEFSDENSYKALEKLCDYLNNHPHSHTYRFATHEELVRVALYQRTRTK